MKTIKLQVEIEVPDDYELESTDWLLEESVNFCKYNYTSYKI